MNDNYAQIEESIEEIEIQGKPKLNTAGLSHLQKIELSCSATGVAFTKPKPSCNKCDGKGYRGVRVTDEINDEGLPYKRKEAIPCSCVLRDNTQDYKDKMKQYNDLKFTFNRKQRREQEKMLRKMKKKLGID